MRYLNVKKTTIAVRFRSFRPLAGNEVSEQTNSIRKPKIIHISVPSRGLRYLNDLTPIDDELNGGSFRPLSGIKVSELYILCHPRHDIQYIDFKGFLVSDTPLITTLYYTINA